MKKNILILYAKYPEPGKSKTRLAVGTELKPGGIGYDRAAEVYKAFLSDEIDKFSKSKDFDLSICIAESKLDDFKKLFGKKCNYFPDVFKGDLGQSMFYTFDFFLTEKGYKKTIIIGSDIPHLTTDEINTGFATLDKCDVVLGPDDDGGTYLIGMNRPYDILSEIVWSQGTDFEKIKKRARRRNLKVRFLNRTYDVDSIEDLKKLYDELQKPGDRERLELPRTFEVLKVIGSDIFHN